MKTRGEELFCEFLARKGIAFRYELTMTDKRRRPDFAIDWHGVDCFFDVKDRQQIDLPLWTVEAAAQQGARNLLQEREPPYRWLRNKIEKGRAKFAEYKGAPCALVMFASSGFSSDFDHPGFMLGAMYGDYAVQFPADGGEERFVLLENGKMISPHTGAAQNTTISALITLRILDLAAAERRRRHRRLSVTAGEGVASQLGVIVWDNIFATTPLPSDLFRGPFDERWSGDGYGFRRCYVGDGLIEYGIGE